MRWIATDPEKGSQLFNKWSRNYHIHAQPGLEDLCLVFIAQAYLSLDRVEEASQILNNLLKKTDPYSEAMALKTLATLDFRNGRFFVATVKIRSAMELAKTNREEELIAELQEDIAQVFDKVSKPDKAIQFYSRSLQLFTKLDKRTAMQKNALALGRIYLGLEKLDSASIFIQQSLELARQENLKSELFESKIELGNYYFLNKEYTKLESLLYELKMDEPRPEIDFLNVRRYVLQGKYAMAVQSEAEALSEFNKAESFSRQGFTPFIDYYIKSNLADAYYRNGNLNKAYELLKYLNHNNSSYSSKENQKLAELITKDSELNIRDREIDYLKIENQLNEEKLKRELLMRESLRKENEFKDYTLQQEQLLKNASLREKALQTEQLEKEKALNQSLSRENDLRQATITDERNFQTILWFGILILTGLALLIYYLFKKQKEKNDIIVKQTKDLEFVNKEVHHRVKNNLQVISSLLDLQSQSNPDSTTSNLLRESKHRVQSMAFIHQNLYEGEGMNLVDMPSYVENLVEHLKTTFHNDYQNIEIKTSIAPIRLHMDTVVSIGMLINELVTNSLKYAFGGRTRGTIIVSLEDQQSNLTLAVCDNGTGISDEIDASVVKSFGFKMIRAFTQKLKAKMTIENDQGTQVKIRIPKK